MSWQLDLSAAPPSPAPALDEDQAAVVAHDRGPLLVLAGPGTGKTTTIVEAIHARLSDPTDPLPAGSVLALTFGRKAALDLRDRVTARVGGGIIPTIATFHSFAYGLLQQTATEDDYLSVPRLMSGAEEDVRIRELLRGAVVDGTVHWPEDLVGALPTLGLANEVRAVLARAREMGLDGPALRRVGQQAERPAWVAIGQLAQQEQEVMALENVLDYGELLVQAVIRAHEPNVQRSLRARYRAIYVDEYQDTDPLQVALLKALAGPDTTLVAVGDPDQAIYGFRGADVGGIVRFSETFRTDRGEPAPVAVLGTARRFGPRIRAAAAAVLGDRIPAGLSVEVMRAHRSPTCRPAGGQTDQEPTDDLISLRTYADRGSQAAHVAREIRQAHVRRRVAWREIAVLVRSGSEIPAVQRALHAAGIPVVVASDEIPLRQEPAVATLLGVLDLAAHPGPASPAQVLDVLTGPMVGLTAGDVRRLGRALRAAHHRAGHAAPSSDQLIRDLVLSPVLGQVPGDPGLPPDDEASVAVQRLAGLLTQAHAQVQAGAGPEEVLWTLWSGGRHAHGWPERLRAAALAGNRSADHDLDAIMALFDAASRLAGRYPGFLGVRMFLDSLSDQQIPAESIADRGVRADAVRILTAHRAKGLEWDEVWVVGIQEGTWPDLRARGSTLRAEELTAQGIGSGSRPSDLLAEERRLLFVACTRARRQLHLSAVDSADDAGDRPSRFLDDLRAALNLDRPHPTAGRPAHQASLDGLVAEWRAVALDPTSSEGLQEAAIQRLAALAAQRDDRDRPLVPLADPSTWWGMRESTVNVRPLRDPDLPVRLSGSSLDTVLGCPLTWFLEREVHAETVRGTSTSFGSIVHAIADFVAQGQVPADLPAMESELDRVWSELRFDARWQSSAERAQAKAALARFLGYHQSAERQLLGTETPVRVEVPVTTPSGASDVVALSGFIDRVERDDEGRLVAIDLKNMRTAVPTKDLPEHGQLGIYQLLLQRGVVSDMDEAGEAPREVGGAALVQLRLDAGRGSTDAKVQFQPPLPADTSAVDEPTWVEIKLGEAAGILRSGEIVATTGRSCTYCSYASACPAQPRGEQVTP